VTEKENRVTQRIWQRIENARERWGVLRHPFYRRWSAGDLGPGELGRYSGQYRHAVEAIAAVSEAAAEAAPERLELRRHAEEERDHVELWDRFLVAAQGELDDEPTAETAECVRTWSRGEELVSSLITLYAIESGQPEISKVKRRGLVERYGFADGPGTAYFRVHEQRDAQHAAEARDLLEELAMEWDADVLVATAEAAMRANWRPPIDSDSLIMRWRDRVIGIALGVVLGVGVVVVFVFVYSERTVDAPSLARNGRGGHGGGGGGGSGGGPPPVATVEVVNGIPPAAGPAELAYRRGELVRLRLVSDASVVVELSVYGIERTVAAGRPSMIRFKASKPGNFPLLVTTSHIAVARITVGGPGL
jgi:pyrroloquinoline-quinone synthase